MISISYREEFVDKIKRYYAVTAGEFLRREKADTLITDYLFDLHDDLMVESEASGRRLDFEHDRIMFNDYELKFEFAEKQIKVYRSDHGLGKKEEIDVLIDNGHIYYSAKYDLELCIELMDKYLKVGLGDLL